MKVISRAIAFLPALIFILLIATVYGKENHRDSINQRADILYNDAKKYYHTLVNSKKIQSEKSNWLNCILKFESIYKKFPSSHIADKSLFTAARLYSELFTKSSDKSDIEQAIRLFNKLIREYKDSPFADDAQYMVGEVYFKTNNYPLAYASYSTVINNYPNGDMVKKAKNKLSKLLKIYQPTDNYTEQLMLSNLITVKGIKYWSSTEYTRIVIDTEDKVEYKEQRIKDPDRLFIDIYNSKLSPEINEMIAINDGLLKSVRVGQNQKDIVRIVLDMDSIGSYSIISLSNPFRIVVDIDDSLIGKNGKNHIKAAIPKEGKTGTSEQGAEKKVESLNQNIIKRIVIDAGHGGKDSGAIGKKGLMEKTVVLDIARRLKDIIEKKTDYEVILTRYSDIFIPLEERTVIANVKKADLFISIHANASRKRSARGIETYFQGIPRTDEERETAARENMSGGEGEYAPDDNLLEFILADMRNTHKINESAQLAGVIQGSLVKGMGSRYDEVRDLGVKQALFYVLHKAKMPSILIETSFISNHEEEKRFKDQKYRDYIAACIYDGIKTYIEKTIIAYRTE